MCNGCLLSRNAFAPLSSLKRASSTPHKTCGTECQELKSSRFTLSTEEEVIVLARAGCLHGNGGKRGRHSYYNCHQVAQVRPSFLQRLPPTGLPRPQAYAVHASRERDLSFFLF